MVQLERELENLRAALSFLLEQAQAQAGSQGGVLQAERAMRLCVTLHWFWYDRGYVREGQVFLERALARYEQVRDAAHSRLGGKLFTTAWTQGRSMTPEQAVAGAAIGHGG